MMTGAILPRELLPRPSATSVIIRRRIDVSGGRFLAGTTAGPVRLLIMRKVGVTIAGRALSVDQIEVLRETVGATLEGMGDDDVRAAIGSERAAAYEARLRELVAMLARVGVLPDASRSAAE